MFIVSFERSLCFVDVSESDRTWTTPCTEQFYCHSCTAHVTCEQEVFFSTVESRAAELLQAALWSNDFGNDWFLSWYFSCSLASILRLSWNLCNRLQMDCCGFASTSIPQIGSLACEKNPNSAVESLRKNQAFWWIRVVGGSGTERVSPCVSCWGQKVGWANL